MVSQPHLIEARLPALFLSPPDHNFCPLLKPSWNYPLSFSQISSSKNEYILKNYRCQSLSLSSLKDLAASFLLGPLQSSLLSSRQRSAAAFLFFPGLVWKPPTRPDMLRDSLIMRRSYSERERGQVRGSGRGWGQGPAGTFVGRGVRMLRQGPLRINRSSPFKIAKSFSRTKDLLWRHDLFEDSMAAAGLGGAEGGTKLYISNLDHGVSNEDIKELFSEFGDLKHSATHYDRNGRPSGSAEVVYARRSDAIAAVKRYNNVQLDGKPMKIEIIGNNLGLPIAPRVNVVGGANGRGKRTVVMTPDFGQGVGAFKQLSGWNRGRGRGRGHVQGQSSDLGIVRGRNLRGRVRGRIGSRGRGRGRGSKQPSRKTAEDLDKELETYHAGAMDTS